MHSLTFHNTQFDIVDRNGHPWVRANQIGLALEYKNPELSIAKLYRSNAEEFSDKMTALIEMPTKGGVQQVRIFSLRGAHLLAMFARTKVAKEFRHWVLDVLEGEAEAPSPVKEKRAPKALPNGLSTDQQDAIKALVKARVDELPEAKRAKAAITCWSSLKSKFGCTYKKIAPEQFTEAVSLIARVVLEGELLEAEQAKPLEIDFPVSRWLKDNPWIAKRQQFQGPGNLSVSADMLYGMDARSPTRRLLSDLRNAGYNIDACWIEVLSMQHHLEVTRSYLRTIQSGIDNTLHQSVRFKVGESEKGSKE